MEEENKRWRRMTEKRKGVEENPEDGDKEEEEVKKKR